MKHVFIVPIVRQVALDDVLSEMAQVLKSLVKDLCSYFFYSENWS